MTDESLFAAALALPASERAAYLDAHCPDPAVRKQVEELLAAADASNPLDRRPVDVEQTISRTQQPPEPSASVGDRIGPYKLLEKIGEGGMGEVWVADQLEPIKRRVALKLIKPGMDSRSVLGRFEAERQALAVMDHPNIARVLDAGTTADGRPFFVMELVKGTPITEFADARRLTPKQRLELFVPVCQAIQHAHMKGIIHRDIKPGNVLVALHDEVPVPKVIDFGVAKAVGQQLTEKTIYTGFGALVGTPAYMAPEQATFNQLDVDTRADVYALGVLLYELLAGSPPIEKERLLKAALDEVLRIVREEEPPRPSQRLSTADTRASIAAVRGTEPAKLSALMKGELDWIVMKALEKDRARRYETAAGFAADVQRYLTGEPVQAVPPSVGYRLNKFYRRNRAGVRVVTFFVFMALGAAVMGAVLAVRATEAERQAKADRDAAVKAKEEADGERTRANAEAANVRAAKERLRRTLYAAEMSLVRMALDSADTYRAEQLLARQRPGAGETDLRGFEWHYLDRQVHPELASVKLADSLGLFQVAGSWATWPLSSNVALSSDGRFVAWVAGDVTARPAVVVAEAATGREVLRVPRPDIPAVNPDTLALGRWPDLLFTMAGTHLLVRWPEADPKLDAHAWPDRLTAHRLTDGAVAFDRTGSVQFAVADRRVALWTFDRPVGHAGEAAGTLEVWDPDQDKVVLKREFARTPGRRLSVADISRDGTKVALVDSPAGDDLTAPLTVRMVDVDSGKDGAGLTDLTTKSVSLALSPAGDRLAGRKSFPSPLGSTEPGAWVWDTATGKEVLAVHELVGVMGGVQFGPDGNTLLFHHPPQMGERAVSVRDAKSGKVLAQYAATGGIDLAAAFTPDGKSVRTVGRNGVSKLWAVPTPPTQHEQVQVLSAAPSLRRFLLTRTDKKTGLLIQVADADGGDVVTLKRVDGYHACQGVFSPDGVRVAVTDTVRLTSKDGEAPKGRQSLHVFEVRTGREVWSYDRLERWPLHVEFSPDGRSVGLFQAGSKVNGVSDLLVFDADTGAERWRGEAFGGVNGLGVRTGGERVAAVFHPTAPRALAAAGVRDGPAPAALALCELSNGKPVLTMTGPAGLTVCAAAFSPDGRFVTAVYGRSYAAHHPPRRDIPCRLITWDAETGAEVWTAEVDDCDVATLTFSSNGGRLAVGLMHTEQIRRGFRVRLFDAPTGMNGYTLVDDVSPQGGVAFSPDGSRVVTGQRTGTVQGELKVWDTVTGRELLAIPDTGRAEVARFTPDGTRLFAFGFGAGLATKTADVYDGSPRPGPKK